VVLPRLLAEHPCVVCGVAQQNLLSCKALATPQILHFGAFINGKPSLPLVAPFLSKDPSLFRGVNGSPTDLVDFLTFKVLSGKILHTLRGINSCGERATYTQGATNYPGFARAHKHHGGMIIHLTGGTKPAVNILLRTASVLLRQHTLSVGHRNVASLLTVPDTVTSLLSQHGGSPIPGL